MHYKRIVVCLLCHKCNALAHKHVYGYSGPIMALTAYIHLSSNCFLENTTDGTATIEPPRTGDGFTAGNHCATTFN